MGIFDKLKFWKKDDFSDFENLGNDAMNPPDPLGANPNDPLKDPLNDSLNDPLADPLGNDPFPKPDTPRTNPLATGNQNSFDHVAQRPANDPFTSQFQGQQGNMGKDIEIISAKIDTVRLSVENLGHKIDNLNQRLIAIEKIANESQQW